ncbi:MAG: CocE/NonD family hydrolase [Vicingaceae bacterium]
MHYRLLFLLFLNCLFLNAQVTLSKKVVLEEGIALATNIYLPNSKGQFSCILIRTPYNKQGADIFAQYFQKKGFAVVVQDVRGKYESEGEFIPFIHEYEDGLQTLDWITQQPWSNQSVGMWGSSYLAYSALILAQYQHPALKSVFALSGWIEGEEINNPGGAFHQMLVIPWLLFEGKQSAQSIAGMDLEELFSHLPLKEATPSMEFLSKLDSEKRNKEQAFNYQRVDIPIMQIGGWFDFATNASLSAYQKIKSSGTQQKLVLGAWYHNQIYDENKRIGEYRLPPEGRMNLDQLLAKAAEWFDQTLNQEDGVESGVEYYVLYENAWRQAEAWPPENNISKEFFLKADSLSSRIPDFETSQYEFTYDPNEPTPTLGGANFHFFLNTIGIQEQSKIEQREDVLSFSTSEFDSDQIYAGEVEVELFVSSEGLGTDFTAKLCKLDTAGKVWNLVDGIQRLDSSLDLTEPQKVKIKLGNVAFQIKEGEKLKLLISSSNFPKFNRNPNTGIDPMDAIHLKAVRQTIFHNPLQLSKLTLYQLIP